MRRKDWDWEDLKKANTIPPETLWRVQGKRVTPSEKTIAALEETLEFPVPHLVGIWVDQTKEEAIRRQAESATLQNVRACLDNYHDGTKGT